MRVFYAGLGHDAEWERILNGELIYLPDESIKLGKVSDLHNPFSDAFDISKCGDISKGLLLRMGLRKGIRDENKDMVEVHFTPRLIAKNKIEGEAAYLKEIMAEWAEENQIAPIFTWWKWNNSNLMYCVWADFKMLSENSLREIYLNKETKQLTSSGYLRWPHGVVGRVSSFMLRF